MTYQSRCSPYVHSAIRMNRIMTSRYHIRFVARQSIIFFRRGRFCLSRSPRSIRLCGMRSLDIAVV